MKKTLIILSSILALFLLVSCENSKQKKAQDESAPEASTINEDGSASAASGRNIRPPSAEKAPDFTFKDINGKSAKLSDYRGKVVVLDFWATWCPPCKMEIPFFIELEEQYGKQGLAILGAALDDPRKVKTFYRNNNMNYPVFIADQQMAMNYGGIQGIPTTFIIDKDGYIRDKFVGYRPKQVFEEAFLGLK